MRIVIIGGGVIGLLTAIECASTGHSVSLFDQGTVPSPAAASSDRHRVVRGLHVGNPSATASAIEAHHLWTELQNFLSCSFYKRIGALTVLPVEQLGPADRMLTGSGSRTRTIGPEGLASQYPHIRFPDGAGALVESHAGVLLADRVVATCAAWLGMHPLVKLHPGRRAVGVDVDRSSVRFEDGEVVRGDAVLLATGAWSRELLAPEVAGRLVLNRQSMIYCEVPAKDADAWSSMPAVVSIGTGNGSWLVPPVADTPLKFSAASATRVVSRVEGNDTPAKWRDHLLDAASAVLPGFSEEWLFGTRDCYYLADSETGGALPVSLSRTVLAFAACGGGAFKFAPLVARSLARELTGTAPARSRASVPVASGVATIARIAQMLPGPRKPPPPTPAIRGLS